MLHAFNHDLALFSLLLRVLFRKFPFLSISGNVSSFPGYCMYTITLIAISYVPA